MLVKIPGDSTVFVAWVDMIKNRSGTALIIIFKCCAFSSRKRQFVFGRLSEKCVFAIAVHLRPLAFLSNYDMQVFFIHSIGYNTYIV